MNKQIYLKPARKGLIVRDPSTAAPLPEEGAWKPRSSYWMRRLRDGDAIEVKPPKRTAAKQEEN